MTCMDLVEHWQRFAKCSCLREEHYLLRARYCSSVEWRDSIGIAAAPHLRRIPRRIGSRSEVGLRRTIRVGLASSHRKWWSLCFLVRRVAIQSSSNYLGKLNCVPLGEATVHQPILLAAAFHVLCWDSIGIRWWGFVTPPYSAIKPNSTGDYGGGNASERWFECVEVRSRLPSLSMLFWKEYPSWQISQQIP